MPGVRWLAWTKSFSCKTQKNQVHDPSTSTRSTTSRLLTGRSRRSSCSWSLSCLKDVVQGNTRVTHKSNSCSPQYSQGSDDSLQEISSEVLDLTESSCELRLASLGSLRSLKPEIPKPSIQSSLALKKMQPRKFSGCIEAMDISARSSLPQTSQPDYSKCRDSVVHQAVSELSVDDCSRSVVEIIIRSSWMKNELNILNINQIFKVHNTPITLSRFEAYRDFVKDKASNNMPSKHPRCIVDGNELLRFHTTTMVCSLGAQTMCCLCTLHNCEVCRILRSGFSTGNGRGIHTTATSGKAYDSTNRKSCHGQKGDKLAMLVCRVIAGWIYKTPDYLKHLIPPSGYDSIAGETCTHSIVDDLVVYNSEAVLPCFVVVYDC